MYPPNNRIALYVLAFFAGAMPISSCALSADIFGAATTQPSTAPAHVVLNPAIPDLPPPPRSNAQPHLNTAIIPYPQFYDDSLKIARNNITTFNRLHARNIARAKQGGIDVLFLGDSITQFWSSAGRAVWRANFSDPKFANFGISADRTQNVLWRLQNGEGEGYTPKAVVLMIGTNNLGLEVNGKTFRNTGPEIAAGIDAIVQELQKRFPQVKILLFGIFPRGEKDDVAKEPMRRYAGEVNRIIAKYDDGQRVFYIDIGPKFLDSDGNILPGIMADRQKIHPARAGYEIWAQAINQRLPALGIPTTQASTP